MRLLAFPPGVSQPRITASLLVESVHSNVLFEVYPIILLSMFSITSFGKFPFSISNITFSILNIIFPKISCSFEINVMLLCRFTQSLLDLLQYHAGQEMCLEGGFLYHVANDDGEMLLTPPCRLTHPPQCRERAALHIRFDRCC